MGLDSIRKDINTEKWSIQGKQIKEEKKSETSDQRLWAYTRFFKAAGTGVLLATAGMRGAAAEQPRSIQNLSGGDNATGLLPPSNQRGQFIGYSPPEGYVPSEKDMKQLNEFLEKMNKPPFYFDPSKDTQATLSGETSQSAMETHQREQDRNKGTDHRSSNGEKIEALRSLMDNLKEDREALQSLKKMLNERRARSLLERGSAAHTLTPDKTSTCHDPCSETPASVDCIKQCTTTVSSNPSACLDVSISEVLAKVEPVSGLPAPNQQVRLNYTLSVQNHCPQTIKDVTYHIQGTGGCPNPSAFIPAPDTGVSIQSFSADASSVAPGDSAGVKAGQDTSIISRCETYGGGFRITSSSLPPELSVSISASGTDSTTNLAVSSQEKIFTVLGSSSNEQCDLKCPPATGTTSTDTPSIVFVHGFKPSSLKRGDDSGQDCNTYWGDAVNFLRDRGIRDLRTIKYYNGDRNCQNGDDEGRYSSDLHDTLYNSSCTEYRAESGGTNDESLYHLSCLFAHYLHQNFGQFHRNVVLVGHSMGGIIMRETLYQMQDGVREDPFPPTIGRVTKAITFNTPHEGTNDVYAYWGCNGCTQGQELSSRSEIIQNLGTSGRYPHPPEVVTEWTTIGSQCDPAVIPAQGSVGMDANHAVVYSGIPGVIPTCYDHTQARQDANTKQDAQYYCCDTRDPERHPCGSEYRPEKNSRWRKTATGLRGLDLLYTEVTKGLPCSARRMRPRLWMAATLASAWALLAR